MTLKLNGSTSGYVTIDAPAVAGTTAITLPAVSGGSFVVSDSSGNVGIGTTSPTAPLDVKVGTGNFTVGLQGAGNALLTASSTMQLDAAGASSAMVFKTVSTERMRIDSSGNVGIGTTNINAKFVVSNAGAAGLEIAPTGFSSAPSIVSYNRSGAAYTQLTLDASVNVFAISGTEKARIDSSGNLLVGTTDPADISGTGFKLKPNGDGTGWARFNVVTTATTNAQNNGYSFYSTGAGAYRFYVGAGGTIFATSTSITAISDQSLKTNVKPLETGLAEVMKLQPRRFDWIDQNAHEGTNVAGFIAQEVEQVLPDLVEPYDYTEEETKLGLRMGDMIPTLVKAIQEQQTVIEDLKFRIAVLESK